MLHAGVAHGPAATPVQQYADRTPRVQGRKHIIMLTSGPISKVCQLKRDIADSASLVLSACTLRTV